LVQVARRQHGVISRRQALAGGLSDEAVEAHLRACRWRTVFRGVYATFNGPLPRTSLLWAAVLRAGPGAVLSHETAAELLGLGPTGDGRIHISVPARRTPHPIPGVVIHRCARVGRSRHPTRTPPQTRIEETVVDLTQAARTIEEALGWLARAIGARLTTPARLSAAFAGRPRLRWRRPLHSAVEDVAQGCQSLPELTYLNTVERAHGLPTAHRQRRRERPGGSYYDDLSYERYRTLVELDGRAAHPSHARWRDMRRDNAAVVAGRHVLRYGLGDIVERPCDIATQVGRVLTRNGWRGRPQRCRRPDCVITEKSRGRVRGSAR
jgi:very-short-patch-repair endonuclease